MIHLPVHAAVLRVIGSTKTAAGRQPNANKTILWPLLIIPLSIILINYYHFPDNDMRIFNRREISVYLLRFGILFVISPVLIYLSIIFKGDTILKWSYPFSSLGSGPFQAIVYGLLIIIGLILIGISKFIRSK